MKKTITLVAAGLLLAATNATHAQIANGTLEAWRTVNINPSGNYEVPQSWYSVDSAIFTIAPGIGQVGKKQCYKSTDVHGGTAAAMLMSRTYGAIGVVPGALSNAQINLSLATQSFNRVGGTAVSTRVSSGSAWVKYVPKGANDSATMVVAAVLAGRGAGGTDSTVGGGFVTFGAKAAYGQVTANVTYINPTVVPDHFQVAFTSSTFQAPGATDSSLLYVDDVTFTAPSGVTRVLFNADVMQVYPNPASGILNLKSNEATLLTWEAIGTNGQVLAHKEFTGTASVSLNSFAAGTYFFRVLNDKKELVQTGKFLVK